MVNNTLISKSNIIFLEFSEYKAGMLVKLIRSNQLMRVETFIFDDFPTNDKFCDRILCRWCDEGICKEEIYSWEDVEILEE